MANATSKPYAWLMPVEQKEPSNNNNRDLKEGSKTMRVKENDSDQTRQTFGEASFVKKSAPSFFRNLPTSPVTPRKNALSVKQTLPNQQMDEKLPPDVIDLSLSSDEEWMNEVLNDDFEENKDKLSDEKLCAKDDADATVVDEQKEEETFEEAIEEKPATPPPTPEEIKDDLSTIKEDEEFDSEDDGWDDYRAARATGSTSFGVEKPVESVNAFGTTQAMDGSGDQNMNVVKAPTFGRIQATGDQEHKEIPPKDDNPPKKQQKDLHPIYFDFSQDDNEKLSADESDKMKLVTTQPEETVSDEDDGWDDYRVMNAHTSRNINNSNKAKETVNGEKTAAFGVIPEKMNEWMTRNGSKGDIQVSNQMPFSLGSTDISKNTLNCSGNSPVPDMWGPLVKAGNEKKSSNWAANEFFSKGDSAWNNALVREKPSTRGPWRGNYGEFVPDLPKREPIDSKRQLFHQTSSNVFGLPSPQKPEKRIARESLQGFERVLRMNKAVNSRRENKLAENAKKLFQRSKTPDSEPHLSQQYFMKPPEMKRVPYESFLSRTFTPSDVSMMPKFSGNNYGMSDRLNSNHNNKVPYPMNFDPRRAQNAITPGKRAGSEMQEVAPSSRSYRIIEGTRRLFNSKEIRDFVRMTDQQTYYMLAEDLAFF